MHHLINLLLYRTHPVADTEMEGPMCIGLKRTAVILAEHNPEWDRVAKETITVLQGLLGNAAIDIQHVGSTAIHGVAAKPIIDLVVGVGDFDHILCQNDILNDAGIQYRGQDVEGQLLYVMGDLQNEVRTHHIHVVIYGSSAWNHYLDFRDYLNATPTVAAQYVSLKKSLAKEYPGNRAMYTARKKSLIDDILTAASVWRNSQA